MNSVSLESLNNRPGKKEQGLKRNSRANNRLTAVNESSDERYCGGSVCETSWKPAQQPDLQTKKSS